MSPVFTAPGQDRPCDPGHFVGERAGDDIDVMSLQQGLNPQAECIGTALDTAYDRACAVHEQRSQVFVAALADTEQVDAATR